MNEDRENTGNGITDSQATVLILNRAMPILQPLGRTLLKRIAPSCDLLQAVCLEGEA